MSPTKRVRLYLVEVRPQFVLDDGEQLTPITPKAIVVNAADWPLFAASGIEEARAQLEKQVNEV